MLWILIVPTIIATTGASAWAYLYPENFNSRFTQGQLISFLVTTQLITLSLFLVCCIRSGVNKAGMWLALPLICLGLFLVGYSYTKLGMVRTFFGAELGVVEEESYHGFPFSLGHAQYKGMVLLVFGIWCAFHPTHEITALTGIWTVALCIQMFIETPEGGLINGQPRVTPAPNA